MQRLSRACPGNSKKAYLAALREDPGRSGLESAHSSRRNGEAFREGMNRRNRGVRARQ
jgi:hypothetical protein